MNNRRLVVLALGCVTIFLSGCPKSSQEAKQGLKAEEIKDYDTALLYYQRALREDPTNTEYKLKTARLRFEAANYHLSQGEKLRDKGNLPLALAEFQKAASIDPANSQAELEVQKVLEALAVRAAAENPAAPPVPSGPVMMEGPPVLRPLPKDRIPDLKMTNDSKIVFQTIANLANLTVVFDPEFQGKRIPFEARNLTLQEALDIAALQSKAFWKPLTGNIIFVASGDPAKRKEYEEEIVKVFYLTNITADKDLTEIVTAIRNMFTPALSKMNVITAQNAIVVRDTPDKVLLVGKLISALDKAKAEVVVEVSIAEVNLDNNRQLGVSPSTSISATFAPPAAASTAGATAASAAVVALNMLKHISTADYNINLPSATVTALLSTNDTRILQNPEIRAVDGQKASLKIGDRVPVATGSFQAGVGAGLGTAGSSVVSPLVNTQFQYQDVGVNIDITPRILPDRDVAMHIKIEVSAVTSNVNIGGIEQPVISQRVVEHDVRLRDGEVNVLGGLIQRMDTKSLSGWPGLAKIPIMRYLFSQDNTDHSSDEILIVLTPRVVRMPNITPENLRSIATGTDQNPQIHFVDDGVTAPIPPPVVPTPAAAAPQTIQPVQTPGVAVIGTIPPPAATAAQVTPATPGGAATLRFEPGTINLKPGDTTTVGIVVENVKDLSSIPLLLQYNPAVISVEEVRHGGFLSADSQAAIVQQPNQAHGQEIISVTRTPNSPGISGTGTVVAVVIKALAPGNSQLSIVQVNAKDSQQRPIQLVTVEGAVKVQ
jgi:general secretion pathway protein D